MGLTDDFNKPDSGGNKPVIYMLVGMIGLMTFVLVVVLMVNKKPRRIPKQQNNSATTIVQEDVTKGQNGNLIEKEEASKLTSDQLDFWDMYKEDDSTIKPSKDTISNSSASYEEKAQALRDEETEEDFSENGIKTEVILPDGSSQWVMINAYIKKHSYDFVGLVDQEEFKRYYDGGTKVSTLGVELNQNSGDVNFTKLKKAGIDFVLLQIGLRGYQNGQLSMDTTFDTYADMASEAGINVGVTFFSQAVTKEEAVEEANLVLTSIGEHAVAYPVVYEVKPIANDTARTDTLSKQKLTENAKAFCETIEAAGYTPMIYGSKYHLLRRLDLTQLQKYEVYLSQEKETPDYPYQFSMWEYKKNMEIDGIEGESNIILNFINYSMR